MSNNKDEVSNFINYSEKVFILSDDDRNISHDVPFKNQYSGVIKIDITAKNNIFIRNHYADGDRFYIHPNDDKQIKISHEFCHIKNRDNTKQYYIPATSIKGMIRNTLEILSYGKLKGKTLDSYLNDKIPDDSNSLHKSDNLDLSEAIFGTTELKGRVNFSHFKAIGEAKEFKLQKEILMTPEAKRKKFGWKNYPILNSEIKSKKGNNEDIVSEFIPLQRATKFEGKLRFHNLRDFEIGAIISALSFHNTKECYHNIGLAKSLGYGKISIKFDYEHTNTVLQAFEEKINIELFEGKMLWHKSEYIEELLKKHSLNKSEFKALSDEDKLNDLKIINNSENIQLLDNFIKKYPNYENINEIISKRDALQKLQQDNRFKTVDEAFKKAYKLLQSKKGNQKQYKKEYDKFIKKWKAEKNNKKSPYIINEIEKLK